MNNNLTTGNIMLVIVIGTGLQQNQLSVLLVDADVFGDPFFFEWKLLQKSSVWIKLLKAVIPGICNDNLAI